MTMGSAESKTKRKDESEVPSSPKNVPSTPIICAKSSNFQSLSEQDPRSPTDGILRTPIEVPKIEPKSESTISSLLHIIDPRSPTDQFHRTPIIIQNDASSQLPPKLHNKILDNARRNMNYTPTSSSKVNKNSHIKSLISPKLLESSPISKRNNEKRKSFVGLLETNIDYTETNLDNFVKTKSFTSNLTICINENDSFLGTIIKCENCDPRSPSTDFLRTPIQILKKIGEVELEDNINEEVVISQEIDDEVSNTTSLLKIVHLRNSSVERSSIEQEEDHQEREVLNQDLDVNEIIDGKVLNRINNLEVQEEFSSTVSNNSEPPEVMADILKDLITHIETLENAKYDETKSDLQINMKEPIIDLTADVQEFDRKLTQIIYEDTESVSLKHTPKIEIDTKSRNRTPMKDRNMIGEPKKNKLKVSDKPRKSVTVDSKIPIFREKKIKVQCENTPPSNMDIKKKRKLCQPKWDSDKTLVI
ncbi:hypothetical protein HHI36_004670 [Cryptolaemus montrouzieri]|uniref:Uncharacterized protein n=1 Tax=Cryptolaemus montrouzieri TaxID=559131 RepID=A0ABD2NRV4_9CUCU